MSKSAKRALRENAKDALLHFAFVLSIALVILSGPVGALLAHAQLTAN